MANFVYTLVKSATSLTEDSGYRAIVQHARNLTKEQTYDALAKQLGYAATAIRACFLGLSQFIKNNADRGNTSHIDGVASFRNTVKGAFETLSGPWVKGTNRLSIAASELDPFKSSLSDITPVNKTGGANPSIASVFDKTTGEYDVITGTDVFSIGGVDLAPDTEAEDEYVAFADKNGVETKCEISLSSLDIVEAKLSEALEAGEYTLCVYTRSGFGEEFGVKKATRKVTIA